MSVLGESVFVVAVPHVCSVGAVDLCVMRVGGCMVGAPGRMCCVFFVLWDFELDYFLLVLFHPRRIVYYRVPDPRFEWGQTST